MSGSSNAPGFSLDDLTARNAVFIFVNYLSMEQSVSFSRQESIIQRAALWMESENIFCSSVMEERVTNYQAVKIAAVFACIIVAVFAKLSLLTFAALGLCVFIMTAPRHFTAGSRKNKKGGEL